MNRYLVTGAYQVRDHEHGTEFDHEFTATEEADLVASGRIQIVARHYRVVGSSRVAGTDPGGTFLGRYTVAQEAALLEGGHIERHDPIVKPAAKASRQEKG